MRRGVSGWWVLGGVLVGAVCWTIGQTVLRGEGGVEGLGFGPMPAVARPLTIVSERSSPGQRRQGGPGIEASGGMGLVTFGADRVALQAAMIRMCAQAGCAYDWRRSYEHAGLECFGPVSVDVSEMPLRRALDEVLRGTGLRYRIEGKRVWLEK